MNIDIFSDPICPWCYIGKVKLDAAVEAYPHDLDLQITWRCFQLNPEMPSQGMDRQTYLNNKFGGESRAQAIYGSIKQAGTEVGIDFQFDAIQTTPNTMKAHRLLRWGQQEAPSQAESLMDNMFKAYFLLGQDLGDNQVLSRIAFASGYDPEAATAVVTSDQFADDLAQEERTARAMGLTGVPFYVVNQRSVVPGAQDSKAWASVFDAEREQG